MKTTEFIEQQIKAGYKIHYHQGIWWENVLPYFCKPVFPLQKIKPGASKPKPTSSFFGYSHCVPYSDKANKSWPIMLLDYKQLRNFSIKSLSSSKRARVRKGLRLLEIRKIDSIVSKIHDMQEICISTAERTKSGRPPEYYKKRYKEWKKYIIRLFRLPKREWWGAFYKDKLIAYIYGFQIDDVMFISAAKSHSNFLNKCPNDALLFTFIEYCMSLKDCREIIFGDYANRVPTLNRFKEKHGFRRVNLPFYTYHNPLIKLSCCVIFKSGHWERLIKLSLKILRK